MFERKREREKERKRVREKERKREREKERKRERVRKFNFFRLRLAVFGNWWHKQRLFGKLAPLRRKIIKV